MMTLKDDLQVEPKSDWLLGLDIALAVSAGVAASETVKLVRELRRHRAEVTVYLTPNADRFVGKTALEWASARRLITDFTSSAAHVFSHQLLLVAPATLNCVNSLSAGLADNVVTTLAQSLLGIMHLERNKAGGNSEIGRNGTDVLPNSNKRNSPLALPSRFLLAPSMHASMQANPIYQQAMEKLESLGVICIPSERDEGKAKMASIETLIDYTVRAYNTILSYESMASLETMVLSKGNGNGQKAFSLARKRVLITAGSTHERIDSVRVISNNSSGKTGLWLARRAFHFGADVHLLANVELADKIPPYMATDFFTDSSQYRQRCFSILDLQRFDMAVMVAAVSDFSTKAFAGKMVSKTSFSLQLKPLEKVIDAVVERYPTLKVVGFKLYAGKSKHGLPSDEAIAFEKSKKANTDDKAKIAAVKRAREMLENGIHAVVVNGVEAMKHKGSNGPVRSLYSLEKKEVILHNDEQLAHVLWQLV